MGRARLEIGSLSEAGAAFIVTLVVRIGLDHHFLVAGESLSWVKIRAVFHTSDRDERGIQEFMKLSPDTVAAGWTGC